MKKLRTNKGFTLVELIIVIAILAIIMLIAIPNLSGIKHEMEVSADKASAANIGKSVRVWYTKYQVEPEFKKAVDAIVTAGTDVEEDNIPDRDEAPTEPATLSTTMVAIHQLPKIQNYTDSTLAPSSLLTADKTPSKKQLYWVGIIGTGTAEKIVMGIGDTAPTIGSEVTYTGEAGGIAYVEP